jgi:hypothetical protein
MSTTAGTPLNSIQTRHITEQQKNQVYGMLTKAGMTLKGHGKEIDIFIFY